MHMKSAALIPTLLVVLTSPMIYPQTSAASRAIYLEQVGDLPSAEKAWRAVTTDNPRDAGAFANLGVVLSKEERYGDAAAAYRQALALNSNLKGVQLNLGLAEFKQGHFSQAIAPFDAALRADPASLQVDTLLGMTYYGAAEFSKSVPYLQIAVKSEPENLELRGVLAQACLNIKQYDCALEQDQQINKINPDSAQAHMLAGEALDGLHRTDEAIAEFRLAKKVAPNEPNVHFGLGYLLWERKQYSDAAPEFQAELDNTPNHAQALTYLADCRLALNQPEIARPLLERAVQADPGNELAHLDLGMIDADANRREDALREFGTAEKLAPNDVNVHWRLGRLYRSMGNMDLAKAEFDKAKSITQTADTNLVNQLNSQAGKTPAAGAK